MAPRPSLAAGLALLLLATTALAGCTGGSGTETLSNNRDNLRYTGQFTGKGGVKTIAWENTGSQANVDLSAQAAQGGFTLRILDANARQVYEGTVDALDNERLTGTTAAGGAPGTWTVEIRYTGFTGQFTLTLRRA